MKVQIKRSDDVDFQIFIISRFLLSLIFVVMAEYLVLMLVGYIQTLWGVRFPLVLLILTIVLFVAPILITLILFARVITDEVQRLEDEKEEAQRSYERQRNLMLSDIAHDLRTPITTIAGYSKALNDGMVTDAEKCKEYLEAIENKSERMSDLITLLFDYVKLGSEGFTLNMEKVDLCELMRENAALLYSDVEEKDMDLIVDIPEEPCIVNADALQFSRVVTNIITNAIRHNEAKTEITLELNPEPGKVEIVISDNGTLIEPEVAEHIFEPFAVGDKSRRTKGGNGLGLSIAKKIVEMHGWKLSLQQNRHGYKKAFIININLP